MLKFHQEQTCEGIIQHLEAREGKTRRDVRERDKGSHMASRNARVEMTFRLDDQLYALEHTGVEPFDGFMKLQNTAHRLVEPFRAEIKSKLSALFDTGVMLVMKLPANAFSTRSKVAAIHSALVRYVTTTAPTLPIGKNYRAQPKISPPQGVPFSVSLSRFDGFSGLAEPFQIIFSPVGSGLRDERIQRACDAKWPKLAQWKQSQGARTILVLEHNDVQTTNVLVVADAYLRVIASRVDAPDETYMVSTYTSPWYAWPIPIDGQSYFDLATQPHFCIDPNGHLINRK
jgi:hypothetical protein